MIPSAIPDEIVALHRALLAALRVDYFPPGMVEMNNWRDFLFVMQPLMESAGGAFSKKDIFAAVGLMRSQNRDANANWSLRFSKIMRDPEAFRDLELISRKTTRPRPPVETVSRTDATGASIAVERDPVATSDPRPISESTRKFMEELAERKSRKATQ